MFYNVPVLVLAFTMSLILFAVITIFIGVTLSEAGAPEYVIYILAAYVAYQLFIELVMEFHECCVVRANTGGLHYNYNNLIHVYFSLKRSMRTLCLFRSPGVPYLATFHPASIVHIFVCSFFFCLITFYIFDLFSLISGLI